MFSNRLPGRTDVNSLTRTLDGLRAAGVAIADLTESNPTNAGFEYPADLLAALGSPEGRRYDPQPRGLAAARDAVAADYARRGADVDPACVVLASSTSEAYSWLFKLLCNPGDSVLVPEPSYPLFEHLTRLEGVRARPYPLRYHGRWEIDVEAIASAPDDVRAAIVVSPNNPTGSYVSKSEAHRLAGVCRARGWAVIADEVFADYPLDAKTPATECMMPLDVVSFTLGGASKSLGLPQIKLGWLVVGGRPDERERALAALEIVADTFLSVGTPVQAAAPALFGRGDLLRRQIHRRLRGNLARAREIAQQHPACTILPVEGGWSLVVRVPATRTEETLVQDLLEREHVLVHPGYFFDFPHEAFIVVSLLPQPDTFADAFARALRFVSA